MAEDNNSDGSKLTIIELDSLEKLAGIDPSCGNVRGIFHILYVPVGCISEYMQAAFSKKSSYLSAGYRPLTIILVSTEDLPEDIKLELLANGTPCAHPDELPRLKLRWAEHLKKSELIRLKTAEQRRQPKPVEPLSDEELRELIDLAQDPYDTGLPIPS